MGIIGGIGGLPQREDLAKARPRSVRICAVPLQTGAPAKRKAALRPSANLGRARLFCLEVSHQPLKSRLIRVVILPIAEVWNEVLSNLAGGTDFNGNDTFT